MTKEQKNKRAEKLLADAYISFAHLEYNLSGSLNTEPLVKFRKGIRLLGININKYLPSEHGEI